ncbi:MAG: preprotein translocase subunit SecA [Chloroherpetonaceae bacterium]|nr:preprotein translocase subunit SecA [Chloroherpetonaceae bacterium]MCS7211598.1 preprotein translocase subunit SecA [Chloroherpetonaceae bacterium]
MLKLLEKIFGSKHEKDVKRLMPIVEEINAHYESFKNLSDDELRAKTQELKARIREHVREIEEELASEQAKLNDLDLTFEEVQATKDRIEELEKELHEATEEILSEILPEAFAIVKDTCRRLVGKEWMAGGSMIKWDMIPYDVQLIGGIVLHEGKIAEMATGEGKTLVATLPAFLNALTGKGVHIVTVNDYLAKRDREWMGPIYEFHGLTVGVILSEMDSAERRKQYAADITYGTNNEFGFDYLRDNMATDKEEIVQRGFNYAIVDEVDSVLIDEARTPLIISGPVPQSDASKFLELKPKVERLVRAQQNLVAKILSEVEKLLEQKEKLDKDWEFKAGLGLLRAKRGQPKNKKFIKLIGEGANARLMQMVENEYLRDNARRMHEVDDELYFSIDERFHQIDLTDKGRALITDANQDPDFFVLPDVGTEIAKIQNDPTLSEAQKQEKKDELYRIFAEKSERIHNVSQLLRAYSLYERDDEYVVQDGKVLIVDEFTGRILVGRRYSDGLHQAIEAKEGVKIEGETQTMATITLQNYFRLYKKLAGMTGTAETEAQEFYEIYKLDVVVIPTHKKVIREDREDLVFKTKREKYNAVIQTIEELRTKGQPVLVGTTSVEVSETISRMLKMRKIPHNVLNAKQHQREAEIIAQAGQKGAVTIATNMAGRGTDIKLGPGVKELGGLFILGTERHEARRIDRQLRGRAGRQGDPGVSQFYVSLEDDLMRLFGSERVAALMDKLGHKEGEVIQHPMVTKAIERAQRRVEEQNFGIRKRLLEYDNVMNQQREIIYARRRNALFKERLRLEIFDLLNDYAERLAEKYLADYNAEGLCEQVLRELGVPIELTREKYAALGKDGVQDLIYQTATAFYKRKEEHLGSEMMGRIERFAVLSVIDEKWREHLRDIDDLKEGINLRAYGQKDPLLEYKKEAFELFVQLLEEIAAQTLSVAFKLYPVEQAAVPMQVRRVQRNRLRAIHAEAASVYSTATTQGGYETDVAEAEEPPKRQPIRVEKVPGRNDPCPCGSGKKYKNCHGKA